MEEIMRKLGVSIGLAMNSQSWKLSDETYKLQYIFKTFHIKKPGSYKKLSF